MVERASSLVRFKKFCPYCGLNIEDKLTHHCVGLPGPVPADTSARDVAEGGQCVRKEVGSFTLAGGLRRSVAFKVGDLVRTRDGRSARVICVDRKDGPPVVALVSGPSGGESLYCYSSDGTFNRGDGLRIQELDLLPAPRRAVVWVVGHWDDKGNRTLNYHVWDHKPPMQLGSCYSRVELEEGRFDDE